MRKLIFLLRKEFKQFIRNPFLPKMVVMFPLLVMLVIPWVMTMDVHHINVSVVDNDHSSFSRRFISKVSASDYFTLKSIHSHYDASLAELEDGKVDVIVEIGDGGNVNISSNGVNAIKGSFGMQYLSKVVSQTAGELSAESGRPVAQISVQTQNRYNPTLNYRYYMIPAVMIMLLIMLCGFLPALNLVGEKEIGTIEQINVTPVGKFTFTLAKLIPYWIMGIVVLSLAMLIASLLYGLTPVGSLWSIYLAAALFVLSMSGLGVIIANYSNTMLQTMMLMFFIVMVFVMMSGILTPVDSMPHWAQVVTYFLPPRYLVDIMRAVYLKGSSIPELWTGYAAIALSAVIFDSWAAISYKKQS
jgi:ABC-2 type transport system permease protein